MRILLLSLFLLANGGESNTLHDFHVSRARIEYAADAQEWQITLHVFIDDLEEALAKRGKEKLYLGTEKEAADADAELEAYLRRYFQLQDKTAELKWNWIGKETSDDLTAFWIYLYVSEVAHPTQIKVVNKILMDVYDDQQNMLQVRGANGKLRNFLFHQDYWEEDISLND